PMLTCLASALGPPWISGALLGVFPMTLGATFLQALPAAQPPLSADAPAPAQNLEKEQRRAGTTGMGHLPNPGIKPRSPALQEDSLPAEPQGKPKNTG
ncbi:unnamed protein product, partial [Rangifer tarandus platyrhynchus]